MVMPETAFSPDSVAMDPPQNNTYNVLFPTFRFPEGLTLPSSFVDVSNNKASIPEWRYKTARGEATLKITFGHSFTLIIYEENPYIKAMADVKNDPYVLQEALPMSKRVYTATNGAVIQDHITAWFTEIGES